MYTNNTQRTSTTPLSAQPKTQTPPLPSCGQLYPRAQHTPKDTSLSQGSELRHKEVIGLSGTLFAALSYGLAWGCGIFKVAGDHSDAFMNLLCQFICLLFGFTIGASIAACLLVCKRPESPKISTV